MGRGLLIKICSPDCERSTDFDSAATQEPLEPLDSPSTFRQVIELLNLFNACTMEANKLPVALLLIFIAVRLRQVNFPTQSFLFAGIVRVTRGFPGSPKISGLPAAPLSRFSECAGPFLAARWMRGDTHSFKSFTLESSGQGKEDWKQLKNWQTRIDCDYSKLLSN